MVVLCNQPAASKPLQHLPEFRLEQDHQHQGAVLQDGQQQPVQARQAQDIAQDHNHEQQEQALQQGASPCMPCQQEQFIDDNCHDQDIHNVDEPYAMGQVPHHIADR